MPLGQSEIKPTTEEVVEQPIYAGTEPEIGSDEQVLEEEIEEEIFLTLPPEEVKEILRRIEQRMIKSKKEKKFRPVNQGKLSEITITT